MPRITHSKWRSTSSQSAPSLPASVATPSKPRPAVRHKEILAKLETMTDPKELEKLQHLKVKIEVICEAPDLKKISDLLKELLAQYISARTCTPFPSLPHHRKTML